MESLLKRGAVVPNFTLPDSEGTLVRRSAFRGKQHLALVFLPSVEDDLARSYLRALAEQHQEIRAAAGTVLAIIRSDEALAEAKYQLELPFALLSDSEGAVAARFLPAGADAGVFMVDRYGELYYGLPAANTHELPPADEVKTWIEAIDNQCVI